MSQADSTQGGNDDPPRRAGQQAHAADDGRVFQSGRDQHNQFITVDTGKRIVPRQLPPAPYRFTGRADELAVLTEMLDEATESITPVVISAIGGVGGIGKTWLSVHWAHEHLDRFPDGQLFVDLRGFSPTAEPMSVAEAVRGFLHALGEDPTKLPVDLDAQIGLYRSLVADRRMLIVLDNAREAQQVAPLLPGGHACTVLVTSRLRLAGLVVNHGARSVDLSVLSEEDSRRLLAGHIGAARLDTEPEAVGSLLRYCAGLPLALSIVAARATAHPNFPLAALADELHDQNIRLDSLDAGEIPLNLRAVFSFSYRALPDDIAELFGLLSLAPGPDIGLPAAAESAGLPIARARFMLLQLETAHLVSQPVPGRFSFHDLLRLYATEQARLNLSEDRRRAALHRLLSFYLHTAHTAERLLDPHRHPIDIDPPAADCNPLALPDLAAADVWFETEHANLLATQLLAGELGRHDSTWQLAWSLDTFHYRRGRLHEWRSTWETSLVSARAIGDPRVLSLAHRLLGDVHLNLGNHAASLRELGEALRVAEEADDRLSQAHAHRILTWACGRQHDDRAALEHATAALSLYRALGEPVRVAAMLNATGWFESRLGDFEGAQQHCEAALRVCRRHDYRVGEANTLVSLGYVAQRTDRPADALAFYQQALALFRDLSSTYYQADTLDRIGQIHAGQGRPESARDAWTAALRIYREKYRPEDAQRVRAELDELGADVEV
ncbi:ATP-binding protein [Nocardia aurantia]|uniref:Regulatory protein AfsR n=1 Tax=Nocardia aurantia TaxID=2585199 RepID=A0A7K0DKW4_9NOCA|nr:tetratricopeptide repeat protein [Nocardia aurantia]MQY26327.1 Regulatory protein AfsR [Nocardia aurantia]